jgi:hypothetical protein
MTIFGISVEWFGIGLVALMLVAVNAGPAIAARFRRTKGEWPADKTAPASFMAYLAAVEKATEGLGAESTLVILRGGLSPNAAVVAKAVSGK